MTNFIDGWLLLKRPWKPTQSYKYVSVVIHFKCQRCQLKKNTATHCEKALSWSASALFLVRENGCAGPAVVHRWLVKAEHQSKILRVKRDCSVPLCWRTPEDGPASSAACPGCACYQKASFWTRHWRSQKCEQGWTLESLHLHWPGIGCCTGRYMI